MRLLFIVLLLGCLTSGMGHADVPVRKKSTQVPVLMETELDSLIPTPRPFAFRLADTLVGEKQSIPKGTELKGSIVVSRPSKRFERPAYMMLQINEIDPVDGPPISVSHELQPQTLLKIQPANDRTIQYFIVENVLLENSSLVFSVPFSLFTHTSAAMFTLVDTLASIGTGALYGLREKPKLMVLNPDLTPQKLRPTSRTYYVIHAVYESVSPIPPVWDLFTKPKDFDYKVGTYLSVPIKTHFLDTIMQLYTSAHTTTVSQQELMVNYTKPSP